MKKKIGAASFYIVVFSTLLLSIIAVAFTMSVISETNRTIDSDLSESAYDSALAGIEDAKVALTKWKKCLKSPEADGCSKIISDIKTKSSNCDVVSGILGKVMTTEGVFIQETTNSGNKTVENNMEQAYTCVTLDANLYDYRSTLDSDNVTKIIPLKVANNDAAAKVRSVRISWYSDTNGTTLDFLNIGANGGVNFPRLLSNQASTPPVISVKLIQTPVSFVMEDLDKGSNTGMLYFVPTNKKNGDSANKLRTANGASANWYAADYYDISSTYGSDKVNILTEGDSMSFSRSNNHQARNIPVAVYCPQNSGSEFACSVSIEIPATTSGNRNADTFMLALSIPYGRPDTDFSVEICQEQTCLPIDNTEDKSRHLKNSAQISIDSTGRANDLYRRVEARVENVDINYPVMTYAIDLEGKNNASEITKNVTSSIFSPLWQNR